MILALQSSTTSEPIGELEVSSVPSIGETIVYNDLSYRVTKKITPVLLRGSEKVIRLRVNLLN